MKRRFGTILTFAVGLVLVAGIAYAAKKKDQITPAASTPDPAHEEEALQAELLAAAGDQAGSSGGGEKSARNVVHAVGYGEAGKEVPATKTVGK